MGLVASTVFWIYTHRAAPILFRQGLSLFCQRWYLTKPHLKKGTLSQKKRCHKTHSIIFSLYLSMDKRQLHDKHVATYLTDDDFAMLDKLAIEENMSLSSFVRYVLRNYMRRKLSKQEKQ